MKTHLLVTIVFALAGTVAFGDPAPTTCPTGAAGFASTTQGSTTINGKVINYTAQTGLLEVTVNPGDFAGIPIGAGNIPGAASTTPFSGCFFYTSYTVATPAGAPARPVTFAFNGGPGASSSLIHMGMFGPVRAVTGTDGLEVPVPFQTQQNPDSMLDLTDAVLIDPIGTGFSTPLPGTDQQAFFGAQDDAESVATFIRNYLINNNREGSPFYIAGESYGGIRGSLVTDLLQEAYSYIPKGVVFISPCFSSTTFQFGAADNQIPYITFFPSMVEIANYHQTVKDQQISSLSEEALYQQALAWSMGPYLNALMSGDNVPATDPIYQQALQMESNYTGISTDLLGPNGLDLRLQDVDFFGDVVEGQAVGRYDGRFIQPLLTGQSAANVDPSGFQISEAFMPAFDWYLRNTLGVQTSQSYEELANISYWPMNSDAIAFDSDGEPEPGFRGQYQAECLRGQRLLRHGLPDGHRGV